MASGNGIDDMPVDRFVVVDSNIPESNRMLHPLSEVARNHPQIRQNIERLPHGSWRHCIRAGDKMRGEVDTKLNGTRQVKRQNVLHINITYEVFRRRRALFLYSLVAAAEGFKFFGNHFTIHAFLLSASRRRR